MTAWLPLLSSWTIQAHSLPDRLIRAVHAGFSLPGAQALLPYSDLLDSLPEASKNPPGEMQAPFSLPAQIPEDVEGPVTLSREVDFGALRAQTAHLRVEQPLGRGRVMLDDEVLAEFDSSRFPAFPCEAPGLLTLDVTDALRLRKRRTLRLCFEAVRPAGIAGSVMLHATAHARLSSVRITPDPARQNMRLSLDVQADDAGVYALRAQAVSPGESLPAWEITLELDAKARRTVSLDLPVPADRFHAGTAYAAPVIKILLFLRTRQASVLPGVLCDSITQMCGYPGKAAPFDLPLTPEECFQPPDPLIMRLKTLALPGVFLPVAAPDALYRALTRAGIAARQLTGGDPALQARLARIPCVTCQHAPDGSGIPLPPELSAWLLCGLIACPRSIPADLTPAEILLEVSGRPLNPWDSGVRSVLEWLRALFVRLRAEAARQGRLSGAICAPGEWHIPDIADALSTALAPLHLGVLPLCGAWWAGSHFSASLHAFVPQGALSPQQRALSLTATAILEDEEGNVLARCDCVCPPEGGALGTISAILPESSCVLQLTTCIQCGGTTLEQSVLPVYVGTRGMLEAAF